MQRQKELLPKNPRPAKKPWCDSTNHTYDLEKDIKRLPTNQLSNAQVYRVNLLPRSYNEEIYLDLHTSGFKTAGKTANVFPRAGTELETKTGRERLARQEATFNATVQERKSEYDHF